MIKLIFILVLLHFSKNTLAQNKNEIDTMILGNTQNYIGKEFLFSNCKSLTGHEYNSQSLKGKSTLVNFWFEACEPCIAEFGTLNKLYKKYRINDNFRLIPFTFESPADALKIAERYSLDYPIICISKEKCYELNLNHGFPTNIITDRMGRVDYIIVGGSIDPREVEKDFDNTIISKIEELLKTQL